MKRVKINKEKLLRMSEYDKNAMDFLVKYQHLLDRELMVVEESKEVLNEIVEENKDFFEPVASPSYKGVF